MLRRFVSFPEDLIWVWCLSIALRVDSWFRATAGVGDASLRRLFDGTKSMGTLSFSKAVDRALRELTVYRPAGGTESGWDARTMTIRQPPGFYRALSF